MIIFSWFFHLQCCRFLRNLPPFATSHLTIKLGFQHALPFFFYFCLYCSIDTLLLYIVNAGTEFPGSSVMIRTSYPSPLFKLLILHPTRTSMGIRILESKETWVMLEVSSSLSILLKNLFIHSFGKHSVLSVCQLLCCV